MRRWRILVVATATLFVVALGAVWWRSRPPAFQPPESVSALAREIDRTVPASLRANQVPGASVAVVHRGRVVWTGAYGEADERTPMRPDTVMQVASVSKAVAAYVLVRLAGAGTLPLDAPIERFTGTWRLPASRFDARAVTLRRLLSHTAGLNVDGYPGLAPDVPVPSTRASLDGASGVGKVRIVDEPGSGWRYSGGGYTVAQLAAETATGRPFAELVEREVLRPAEMTRTGSTCAGVARGHDGTGAPLPRYRLAELAAGGLCSTAPDLARFSALLMRGGPVAHAMAVPAAATGGSYGLGLHTERTRDGGRRLWHDGSNRGWRSRIEVFPDDGWALVVLTNGDRGGDVIADVRRLILR